MMAERGISENYYSNPIEKGGITMSTLSTYLAGHLKLEVGQVGIKAGGITLFLRKILDSAEPVATAAVILLTVCLGVIAFMQVGDAGMMLAVYGDTCRALPPLITAL